MATTSKKTVEEIASRIRLKAEMVNYLPQPKADSYGSARDYAKANKWQFDEEKYLENEEYRLLCEKEYSAYTKDIAAFNDLLSDIYSMLE